MSEQLNCWDFKNCRRGIEGDCPAATAVQLDGAHRGKNGGRTCWAVVGTLCGGVVQGTYASKIGSCLSCEFYSLVRTEEAEAFLPVRDLIAMHRKAEL